MLRHPFTIGAVYEKVGRTSSGEISRQLKGAERLPSPEQQWKTLHGQQQRGMDAENVLRDVVNTIRTFQPSQQDIENVKRAVQGEAVQIPQLSSTDLSYLHGAERLLQELHTGEATFSGAVLDLAHVTDDLRYKAKLYGGSIYLKSAKRQTLAYDKAAEQLANEVVSSVLSGQKRTSKKTIRIEAERAGAQKPPLPIQTLAPGKASKFVEHYQQLNSTTPLLDELYGRALVADEVRRIKTQSPFATHMMTQRGVVGLWYAKMETGGI